jgi:outer membrane protein W
MSLYPGVLLTAGVDYRISENWYAGASLGYEWLFDDPSVRVGGYRVDYDLNGGEFSLYVGRHF